MKPINIKKVLLAFLIVTLTSLSSLAQQTLWVGQSYTFDVTSSVMGITANMSWSTNGGYLSLSGSGFYRNITVTQYFSGTATVTCEWDYKLTSSGSYTHTKRQVTISCRDNQVSISPTSLTMSPGETRYVSYRHQYDNQYTSSANAYFQSSDPSICTVSSSGEVIAKSPGTTYINVYSKISSVSPYCKVIVENVKPASISVPSSISMAAGEQRTLTATIIPSNAQAVISWTSSNTEIATVDNSGNIKALKHGSAQITAYTDNGLSSTCNLTVTKSKLSLSSSHSSGLITKNTVIQLTASNPHASIFYTLDGTKPSRSSKKYADAIDVNNNCKIRAFAIHPDYIDSEILELDFSVTTLSLLSTNPTQGSKNSAPHIIPCFIFSSAIKESEKFSDILLLYENEAIQYETIIDENKLYIVPLIQLENNSFMVEIPENAISNYSKEINTSIISNFDYTSSSINTIDMWTRNSRLMDNGDWYIWGYKEDFPNTSYNISNYQQTPLLALRDIKKIYDSNYYITTTDVLMGWGKNATYYNDGTYILGDGTPYNRENAVVIANNVKKFDGDMYNKGLLKYDNTLWLWGHNSWGQVGNGSTSHVYAPAQVLSNVKDFALNSIFSIALKNDGSVWGWGNGNLLGKSDRMIKTPIRLISDGVKEIQTADWHCIALKETGEVYCFGKNDFGQIGTGSTSQYVSPYKVMDDVVHIYARGGGSFALKNNGDLYRWGLMCSRSNTQTNSPQLIAQGVKDVFLSFDNILILKDDKSLWCAGSNIDGLFANGTSSSDVFSQDFRKIFDDVERVWLNGSNLFVRKTDNSYWGLGRRVGISGNNWGEFFVPTEVYNSSTIDIQNILLPEELIIEVGSRGVALLNIEPSNANYKHISWMSLDNEVVSINELGVLYGHSIGQTNIEVSVCDYNNTISSSTCTVKVVDIGAGIDEIESDFNEEIISIYDFNGVLLFKGNSLCMPILNSGIYIIVSGTKTIKYIKY